MQRKGVEPPLEDEMEQPEVDGVPMSLETSVTRDGEVIISIKGELTIFLDGKEAVLLLALDPDDAIRMGEQISSAGHSAGDPLDSADLIAEASEIINGGGAS